MVAVAVPSIHDRWERPAPRRAPLRLVPPPRSLDRPLVIARPRRGPSPAVYRRRRLLAAVLVVLAVVAAVFVVVPAVSAGVGALGGRPLTPSGAPVSTPMQPVAADTYVVRSGDTLWSIARRMQPSGDIRPLVDRIAAARHGASLRPGDRITRP